LVPVLYGRWAFEMKVRHLGRRNMALGCQSLFAVPNTRSGMIKHHKVQCQPEYKTNSNDNNITTSLFGLLTARGGISQPRSKVKLTSLPPARSIKIGGKK
jgi:hypothetical protein